MLDWAKARGYRQEEIPASSRGHPDHLLPPTRKVRATSHHAALPYAELPEFMRDLSQRDGSAPLEFTILTATRTGEAIGARWDEISGDVWTIPAPRMKSGREHRVPLSERALKLIAKLPRDGDYLFPGSRPATHLSNMALLKVLQRMDRADLTTHGFRRASFPRWRSPNAVTDNVEAAYPRGDLFDKRLMAEWARYCSKPSRAGDVVALHG